MNGATQENLPCFKDVSKVSTICTVQKLSVRFLLFGMSFVLLTLALIYKEEFGCAYLKTSIFLYLALSSVSEHLSLLLLL